ncbi:hypothetical protein SNEBB_007941 [Seison nebaliae]|nr:hypothetical protein SNEBB_007941 [Seison nebaliae]
MGIFLKINVLISLIFIFVRIGVKCVDHHEFRTCDQSSFCKRQRDYRGDVGNSYKVNFDQLSITSRNDDGGGEDKKNYQRILFPLTKHNVLTNKKDELLMLIDILPHNIVRIRVRELTETPVRYRYDASKEVINSKILNDKESRFENIEKKMNEKNEVVKLIAQFSTLKKYVSENVHEEYELIINNNPFRIDLHLLPQHQLVASVNAKNLFNFEISRHKLKMKKKIGETEEKSDDETKEKEEEKVEEFEEENFSENFKSHNDKRPYGPMSIGLDITYYGTRHVYGLPEHADSFNLRSTISNDDSSLMDPYRMYNSDVFEYELNSTMTLYINVPFTMTATSHQSIGTLWMNPSETWVDIKRPINDESILSKIYSFFNSPSDQDENTNDSVNDGAVRDSLNYFKLNKIKEENYSNEIKRLSKQTTVHWMSETGLIDIYLMPSFTPVSVLFSHAILVGTTAIPPVWSIGYHQCRWNYNDEKDVLDVNGGFENYNIPADAIWLDIEHADGKRYFTWDSHNFPNAKDMMETVESNGRHMVLVIDPHLKSDTNYKVYNDALSKKDLLVKNSDGNNFDGWCWPGSSVWPDFMKDEVRYWWGEQMNEENYGTVTNNIGVWNDMNEPSVFSGPEKTMNKDALHSDGLYENRDIHNLYGLWVQRASFEGILRRNEFAKRPFVLSRSGYSGVQKYGAIWTGDNLADWNHLKISIPMCLSLSISGVTFVGADIGGFFKNPSEELFIRWYQLGIFYPFMRVHSHIDTKRREPWVYSSETLNLIRNIIIIRYQYLPYWYFLFYVNEMKGLPPMRPLWYQFLSDEKTYDIEDEFLIGSLLIAPILEENVKEKTIYLPGNGIRWYFIKNVDDIEEFPSGQLVMKNVNIDTIPFFQLGGSIIPKRERLRRSASLMQYDPITLNIALNINNEATGMVYLDDGDSYKYREKKEFILSQIQFSNMTLMGRNLNENVEVEDERLTSIFVERIRIFGLKNIRIKNIICQQKNGEIKNVEFSQPNRNVVVIRKPSIILNNSFQMKLFE